MPRIVELLFNAHQPETGKETFASTCCLLRVSVNLSLHSCMSSPMIVSPRRAISSLVTDNSMMLEGMLFVARNSGSCSCALVGRCRLFCLDFDCACPPGLNKVHTVLLELLGNCLMPYCRSTTGARRTESCWPPRFAGTSRPSGIWGRDLPVKIPREQCGVVWWVWWLPCCPCWCWRVAVLCVLQKAAVNCGSLTAAAK